MFNTSPADRGWNIGIDNRDDRTKLFEQAFSTQAELPKPNFQNWRVNNAKASKLNFSELMLLNEFVEAGVPYQNLPSWVRDSGAIEVDAEEKRRQDNLTKETGLNLTERQTVFNALLAEVEALAELSENPIVKDSSVLLETFDHTAKRFGIGSVMDELQEKFPNAAEAFVKKLKVRDAEERALETDQTSIEAARADIAEAKKKLLVLDALERGEEVND